MRFLGTTIGSIGPILIWLVLSGAQQAQTPVHPVRQSVDLEVVYAPTPVKAGGRSRLDYELHLTNYAGQAFIVRRLEVFDGATGKVVASYAGESVAQRLALVGPKAGSGQRLMLGEGRRAIMYLEVPVDHRSASHALRHRVELEATQGAGESFIVDGGAVPPAQSVLPELGPPLRGGPWAAIYDPMLERGHRRVVYAVAGRARIPGRFAIDWFKVDDQGRVETGDTGRVADVIGYGADVLAVADGVVAATRDGVGEPAKLADAPRPALGDAPGNYIAIDLGNGRYAFYEHLRPGLRVKPGDRIKRGQVIAAVGFTGQTLTPHLHFHVSDANAPLAAEGQPYRLDGFKIVGSYPSIAAFSRREAWVREAGSQAGDYDLPPPNAIVEFPDR